MSELDHEAAWVDGHIEQICDFDYGEIDRRLAGQMGISGDAEAEAAAILSRVLVWCWDTRDVQAALVRFVAFSAGLRPDLLQNRTYKELAAELGVTKQAMSKAALTFQQAFKIKFARSRQLESRKNMSIKARGHRATNPGGYRQKMPVWKRSKLP